MAVGLQLATKNSFVRVQEDINDNLTKLDEAIDFNLLATLGIEYGGILNNTNAKTSGKAYYDTTGKKLYKCIANTSVNYADASYFMELSNNDLLGKLNNLSNFGECIILARIPLDNSKLVVGSKLSATSSENVNNFRFLSFVIAENPSNLEDCSFIGIKTPSDAIGFSSISDAMYELSVSTTKTFALTLITNVGNQLSCLVYRDLAPNFGWADTNNYLLMLGYR